MDKKPTKESVAESSKLQGYLDDIAKYEREFKKWEDRAAKIVKRYRDEGRSNTADSNAAKFNILWSNIQTLVPATFARIPRPDVSRRFRDQDPVGRVAALILERGLEFEVQHYPDYRDTMTQCVHDRFLGGRGTAWVRYEPHFKESPEQGVPEQPEDGVQITEDVEVEAPEEQLDYECAPVDYVHWKDFGHNVARTWEEVTCVWRKVYMSEAAVEERFGAEIAKEIPYDATPEDLKRADRNAQSDVKQQACVIELWDKEDGVACWFSKSMKKFLDEKEDPLKLKEFFPCPKPLFATMTNETLVPVPDFTLYQDQANTLDTLADRAAGLVRMLQVKGVYDASADSSLARLFTEGSNGNLMPVKNWAAFAEKNGLKGQVDIVDLTPIAKALEVVYQSAEQQKQQVYEIMGIPDIVRGSSKPSETLGAQELKGEFASMRLNSMKSEVARFATDVLQIKAQIMCSKFNPKTLATIGAVEQLSEADKQYIGPALALLIGEARMQDPAAESPNPLRSFRIEVNADSMVQMNEEAEKVSRMEFLTANGAFMEKAMKMVAEAGPATPILVPLIMEMWKFGVQGFKVGKTIEGAFDEASEKFKQMAMNPQPQGPSPEMLEQQRKQQEAEHDAALAQHQQAHDQATEQMQAKHEEAVAAREAEHQRQIAEREALHQQAEAAAKARLEEIAQAREDDFNRWKVSRENETKIQVAEISAGATLDAAQIKASQEADEEVNGELDDSGQAADKAKAKTKKRAKPIEKLAEMHGETMKAHGETTQVIAKLVEAISKPKKSKIIRGPDGRATGVEAMQ